MSASAENLFPSGFDLEAATPTTGAAWLDRRRAQALLNFRAAGIPHRRIEEWKYSDLRSALNAPRAPAAIVTTAADPFAAVAGARLLIADGRLDRARSDTVLPEGVEIVDLAALNDDAPGWVTSNFGEVLKNGALGQASLALMRGGVALRIAQDVAAPLHLRFVQHEDAVHARVLIVVEGCASCVLLESHALSEGVTNLGVEFVLTANARLSHVRLSGAAPDAIQVEEIGVRVARDATYRAHFPQTGARLARLELAISLEQKGAQAELSGAGVLDGKLHSDITTHVTHAAGKTTSRQLFKYVAADRSRAIYQGKITVAKGADGSDSLQTAKAIVLGERAEADLKPELEILADDVKCAHGAAVGDLDTDSLFYLRARGIPENEARALLLRAFLEEAVADIADDAVRGAVWRFMEDGLSRATEGTP
jgi:Fe-S cluster assembly protein SufD